MKIEWSRIQGLVISPVESHKDDRGHLEVIYESLTKNHGITPNNGSFKRLVLVESKKGVIRGIHRAQKNVNEIKLLTCVFGSVREILVDLRPKSPTFGEHTEVFLSSSDKKIVILPPGVGQAYEACSEVSVLLYALNTNYNPERDLVINTHDESLGISWDANRTRNLRDKVAMSLSDALSQDLL